MLTLVPVDRPGRDDAHAYDTASRDTERPSAATYGARGCDTAACGATASGIGRAGTSGWWMFGVLLSIMGGVCMAAPPNQRPPAQGPGLEFVPEAGYRRTVELLRLKRELTLPGMALAPGLNLSLSGTRSIPVICVEFSNRPHDFHTNDYQRLLFDPAHPAPSPPRPTLTQYYRDISNGQFIPTGQVMGWYTLPKKDSFYEMANNGLNERLAQLLRFAFEQADEDVDFGQFDNDGPDGLPNSGDDDGIVDTILVIHSENGGECGPPGLNKNIWSHSFQYSRFNANAGPFETNDVRRNESGEPLLGANSKIRIEDYTIQPALACGAASDMPVIVPIGVFCHEYGHALGLPDLYDRTPQDGPDSAGVGNYCLMAGGSYGANGQSANRPVHMSAWCKSVLGWATVIDITDNQQLELEPVQVQNQVYNVDVPGTDGREYFLIEFRDSQWTDPFDERINWDSGFDPAGVAIWHVDESVGESSPNWPFAAHDQGQNDWPSRPNSTSTGFKPRHALVALIQRDRELHLEHNQGRFDDGDLFIDGHDFEDDPEFRAGSRGYTGNPTGISLSGIDLANRTAVMRLDDFPPDAAPLAIPTVSPSASGEISVERVLSDRRTEQPQALKRFSEKAIRSPDDAFTDRELKELSALNPHQVKQALPPRTAQRALREAARWRTRTVSKSVPERDTDNKAIADLIQTSVAETNATVRFDSSGEHVQRIADVAIPLADGSTAEDSVRRVKTLLPAVANKDVKLDLDHVVEQDGTFTFPQTIKYAGEEIALHCNSVKIYYRDNQMVGLDANLIDPTTLKISGKSSELTDAALKARIARELRVSPDRIRVAGQCIYLVNGDPQRARVTERVNVKLGGQHKDIEVLVDGETNQILSLE